MKHIIKTSEKDLYIGFDIGSSSVHCAVLDQNKDIVFCAKSKTHFGNPTIIFSFIYEQLRKKYKDQIKSVSFTGSVGKLIADATKTLFVHDPIAIPLGVHKIMPEAKYVFHMGAKDPYFFEIGKIKVNGNSKVFSSDHSTGTKCGGGSGILAFKQYKRLFGSMFPIELKDTDKLEGEEKKKIILNNINNLEKQSQDIFNYAENQTGKSENNIDVGGRCGVIIQSDMIHLQNSGEDTKDIVKGMNRRIGLNYITDVVRTRSLDKGAVAVGTGGVFINNNIKEILEKEFGFKIELPKFYLAVGAIGVALKAIEKNDNHVVELSMIGSLEEEQKKKIEYTSSLGDALKDVQFFGEEKLADLNELLKDNPKRELSVVLGIDGGSTTSKIAVVEAKTKQLLFKVYIKTHGNPGNAGKDILKEVKQWADDNKIILNVIGTGYTGSSASLYGLLFIDRSKNKNIAMTDVVKDEITCHALGIKHFFKETDTIYEQGGQDAKFTVFDGDVVKFSKMNLSCMAGTGQTMENMAEMIGLDVIQLNEMALKAKKVPVIDQTCGVFGEFGVSELISLGLTKQEIAASIIYQCVGGYINKFVGNERVGKVISAQGGPMLGKGVLAALSKLSGKKINAFPHREVIGAFGAGLAVLKNINYLKQNDIEYETKFRGFEVANMKFKKEKKRCSELFGNTCGERDCNLDIYYVGDAKIIANGLCPIGNPDQEIVRQKPDYVKRYKRILNEHIDKLLNIEKKNKKNKEITIGIPRALTFLNEKGIFYTALYAHLGFKIIVEDESDDKTIDHGIRYCHSEFCFPMKIATGQAKKLYDKVDKVLMVNAIHDIGSGKDKKYCPYVEGQGFHVKASLNLDDKHILHPVLEFEPGGAVDPKEIKRDLERAFDRNFFLPKIRKAISFAIKKNKEFLEHIHKEGKEILENIKQKKEYAYVAIGRGYTIFDQKACSNVEQLFCKKGLNLIPAYFFDTSNVEIEKVSPNMYWKLGRRIVRDNLFVAKDKMLFPVRFTNFNCGPDQMLQYIEKDIFQRANKPWLLLQTDGHNSNKQFATRILAHDETVRQNLDRHKLLSDDGFHVRTTEDKIGSRILGVPYMGDGSIVAAAVFRAFDIRAEAMKTWSDESKEYSNKLTISMACRPFDVQVGDSISWLKSLEKRGIDPNKEVAIFMPDAGGPCRFGQYTQILRRIFNENGYSDVPLISSSAEDGYSGISVPKKDINKLQLLFFKSIFCQDVIYNALLRVRPYEVNKGEANRIYQKCMDMLVNEIEKKDRDLEKVMTKCAILFKNIERINKRYPVVIVIGEIFVRHHRYINEDSVEKLEDNHLEVYISPVIEWVEYSRDLYKFRLMKELKFIQASKEELADRFLDFEKTKLYKPFKKLLEGRESHKAFEIIKHAEEQNIFTRKIGGESGITIGTVSEFAENKFAQNKDVAICGIYHVAPFGCMQETLATSLSRNTLNKYTTSQNVIPFMDAVFGDTPNPNLDAEIAAFAEKCHLKYELIKEKLCV